MKYNYLGDTFVRALSDTLPQLIYRGPEGVHFLFKCCGFQIIIIIFGK